MIRLRNATNDTFRSLRHRNFRIFFTVQAVSFIGTWLQLIAQDLLVYELTDSGKALGLVTAIQFAPTLVLGAWAGVAIDRYDKRKLMTLTSGVMGTTALVLGVLVLTGTATVHWVYALAFVLGTANTFDNPARRTLVNDLVPPEDLTNAVSLNSTLVTSARIVGPALAGILVSTVGMGWCFVFNGVSFLAPLSGLYLLDAAVFRADQRVAKAKGQLREGLRYAWSVDELRVPLLLMAVVGTLAFNYQVLLPLFATRDLGGSPSTYALLMSTYSAGSLAGSLRLARRRHIGTRDLALSSLLLGAGWAALAAAPNIPIACAVLVLTGFAGIGVVSGGNAVLQLTVSPAMRGRVMALFTVVFLGSTPIGGPIAGWFAETWGAPAGILLGAVAATGAGLAVLWFLRRRGIADGETSTRTPAETAVLSAA